MMVHVSCCGGLMMASCTLLGGAMLTSLSSGGCISPFQHLASMKFSPEKTPSRNALNSPEEGYVLGSTYRLRRMTSYKRLKRTHRLSLRIPYRFPGARLKVSEEKWAALEARLIEAVALAPPYEYHPDAGEVSIPKREIIQLHRGMLSVASVITEQLAALEAKRH